MYNIKYQRFTDFKRLNKTTNVRANPTSSTKRQLFDIQMIAFFMLRHSLFFVQLLYHNTSKSTSKQICLQRIQQKTQKPYIFQYCNTFF